jgi:hypothetical protein
MPKSTADTKRAYESRASSLLRRAAGWICFVAVPAACLTLNVWTVLTTLIITLVCVPCGMTIVHLNLTRSLTESEKDTWRNELGLRGPLFWSPTLREHYRIPVTAWTYVRVIDLKTATAALATAQPARTP